MNTLIVICTLAAGYALGRLHAWADRRRRIRAWTEGQLARAEAHAAARDAELAADYPAPRR